jgi:hypothetical protein
MLDYSIKGIYPLVPLIRTSSNESYYLKGQADTYPTALVDFDGNERSSIHLRNSDINILHILLAKLQENGLSSEMKGAVTDAFFRIIDSHRSDWQETCDQLETELGALHRWIEESQKVVATLQLTPTKKAPLSREIGEKNRRFAAQVTIAADAEADYRKYIASVRSLLQLKGGHVRACKGKGRGRDSAGSYGRSKLTLPAPALCSRHLGTRIDARSLTTGSTSKRVSCGINYFDLLSSQNVRNNVQPKVGNRTDRFCSGKNSGRGDRRPGPQN